MTGKISELTQLTGANVADDDDFEIRDTSAGTSGSKRIALLEARKYLMATRGALVKKSAALTAQNVTAAFTAITWNTDVYDTDAIHDTGSNTSRLSVPSGWSWVRLTGRLRVENLTAPNYLAVAIYKNGVTFNGYPQHLGTNDTLATHDIMLVSAPLHVTGGTDYFEMMWNVGVDTSVDIGADSWFAIELIA
jgi:hypothetical protein